MRRKKHRVEETRTEIRVEEYVKAIHKNDSNKPKKPDKAVN